VVIVYVVVYAPHVNLRRFGEHLIMSEGRDRIGRGPLIWNIS
jgi:hypothetical protein